MAQNIYRFIDTHLRKGDGLVPRRVLRTDRSKITSEEEKFSSGICWFGVASMPSELKIFLDEALNAVYLVL